MHPQQTLELTYQRLDVETDPDTVALLEELKACLHTLIYIDQPIMYFPRNVRHVAQDIVMDASQKRVPTTVPFGSPSMPRSSQELAEERRLKNLNQQNGQGVTVPEVPK